jgi:hypothetical protein
MTLDQFLSNIGMNRTAFSRVLGVTPKTVHRYCLRDRIPEPRMMQRIYLETNGCVTPNDFYPECFALVDRARRKRCA